MIDIGRPGSLRIRQLAMATVAAAAVSVAVAAPAAAGEVPPARAAHAPQQVEPQKFEVCPFKVTQNTDIWNYPTYWGGPPAERKIVGRATAGQRFIGKRGIWDWVRWDGKGWIFRSATQTGPCYVP